MGNFLDAQGQLTPQSVVRNGRNSNTSEILCMSSLPASIKRVGTKTTEKRWRHRFPHYKSMGALCCHGKQSFDPICPKTLCSLSPTPVMLHIKFDQDWPTGFRDIQVWKCGRWLTTTDGRRTIGILQAHLVSLRLRWAKNWSNCTNRNPPPPSANMNPWSKNPGYAPRQRRANSGIWQIFKLFQVFMHVLVICKFNKDPARASVLHYAPNIWWPQRYGYSSKEIL